MPATSRGSVMPLFDRLAASGETQFPGRNVLRDSVARDLGRLLNTRSRLTFEAFGATDGSVIDYGVPDFSERSMRSVSRWLSALSRLVSSANRDSVATGRTDVAI